MAFIEENFGPVGAFHGSSQGDNTTGVAVYSYITPDVLSTVVGNGYFNDLRDNVFQGDIIYVGATQLDDNSSNNEYSIIYFNSVPRSPLTTDVTIDGKTIDADATP